MLTPRTLEIMGERQGRKKGKEEQEEEEEIRKEKEEEEREATVALVAFKEKALGDDGQGF